jgi:hypothetical protein
MKSISLKPVIAGTRNKFQHNITKMALRHAKKMVNATTAANFGQSIVRLAHLKLNILGFY